MPFGSILRESSFHFDDSVVNLNHGSYGAAPKEVIDARIEGMMKELSFPDKYVRYELEGVTNKARQVFAKELNCIQENVVCVPNATYGMNTALRNFVKAGCRHVIFFSTVYGSCFNIIKDITRDVKITLHNIDVPADVSEPAFFVEELRSKLSQLLSNHKGSEILVLIETVTSMPSITLPYQDLVAACHAQGTYCVVDAAHGLGLLKMDLKKLNPDALVTNAHKWYYGVHSCAALYVPKRHHRKMRNILSGPVIQDSVESGTAKWGDTYEWLGTTDRSAVYAIPAAAKFREEVLGGGTAAIEYQNHLSEQAAAYLTSEWNTKEIANFGPAYRTALFTIESPYYPPKYQLRAFTEFAMEHLYEHHHTFIPFVLYHDRILMRFSAAIYVDLDDFKFGKRAFDETVEVWKDKFEGKSWVR